MIVRAKLNGCYILLFGLFLNTGRGFQQYSAESQESGNRVIYKDMMDVYANGKKNGMKAIITASWGHLTLGYFLMNAYRHRVAKSVSRHMPSITKWNDKQFEFEEPNLNPQIS